MSTVAEKKLEAPSIVDWACNIAIIGTSGSGKSSSIESLPEEKTVILNAESKKLPFRKKFKNERRIEHYNQLLGPRNGSKGLLQIAIASPQFDFIVIDSFTSWTELLLEEAKATEKNYDIYNMYNDEITRLMKVIKFQQTKMIFVTGIPENVDGLDGLVERRLKVSGKIWEGKVEKEFPIVFFTRTKKGEDGKINYYFETQTDSITSAKSPRDMFKDLLIPNDLVKVAEAVREYYK